MSVKHNHGRTTNHGYDIDEYLDEYAAYEEPFNRQRTNRPGRHKRKAPLNATEKQRRHREAVSELADEAAGLEAGFNISYVPGELEEQWLIESLRPFYDQHQISDVVAIIKGGKEANVYRCAAAEGSEVPWLAAKVYRPRIFRTLSNDAMYRKGRNTLGENGRPVKKTDHRLMRALGKKTKFGTQVAHTSWLMYEFNTMQTLYAAGANVPKPYAVAANAILLDYVGDGPLAAPTLSDVRLERGEANRLFEVVLHNLELLLRHNLVHGDLSAYNILYLDGEVTLIDFPQVMTLVLEDGRANDNAHFVLKRDVTRVCQYFARQGVKCDAEAVFREMWEKYVGQADDFLLADLSRMEEAME